MRDYAWLTEDHVLAARESELGGENVYSKNQAASHFHTFDRVECWTQKAGLGLR